MLFLDGTVEAGVRAPALLLTIGLRAPPGQLRHAALLALVVNASGCSSEPPAATAAVMSAGTSGSGGGGAGSASGGSSGVAEGDVGASGAGKASGGAAEANSVTGLGTSDTASEPGSAGTSAGTGTTDAGGDNGGADDASAGGEADLPARLVLFDGTNLEEWRRPGGNGAAGWELPGDGTLVVVPGSGNIVTRQAFDDLFVHVEYKTPALPADITGQDRGNSGIYLNSRYEVQVLDSFGLPPAVDGCGAIYQLRAPSSTACHAQEIWNTYEIEFQAARWDAAGNKQANARVHSTYLNGVLVQENVDIPNSTGLGEPEVPGPRPLMLQDHGTRVAFRNIWIIPR